MEPTLRTAPRYNLMSVASPFLGALAVYLFLEAFGAQGHWYWTWKGTVAALIFAVFCALGSVLAFIALARLERYWPVSVLGLVLNLPFPLLFLGSGLAGLIGWLSDW